MVSHPYAPSELELPNYVPNMMSGAEIIVIYAAICALVCIVVGFASAGSRGDERLILCWLAVTGLTHLVLEAYFVFTPGFVSVGSPLLMAEVWKEYSKADSRYASRDPAVVAVEIVLSLFDGPASLLAMYAVARRKPYAEPLLLAISTTDVCMFAVYFASAWAGGNAYHSSSYHFWVYYITLNSLYGLWIPALIAWRSWTRIARAMDAAKLAANNTKKD